MVGRFTSSLKGRSVVGADGRIFGEVIDVEVDVSSWTVSGLVVRVPSTAVVDLGISKPLWRRAQLSIPTPDVQAVTDVVVLRLSIEDFNRHLATATAEPEESEASGGPSGGPSGGQDPGQNRA